MRRYSVLGAVALGETEGRFAQQRRYYDPGANPMPTPPTPAGKPTVVKWTRQLVRSIRRELTEHSFHRAKLQAVALGWPVETKDTDPPVSEASWRQIWIAELERAIAAAAEVRDA